MRTATIAKPASIGYEELIVALIHRPSARTKLLEAIEETAPTIRAT